VQFRGSTAHQRERRSIVRRYADDEAAIGRNVILMTTKAAPTISFAPAAEVRWPWLRRDRKRQPSIYCLR
jgi:hypothetical protein